MAVEGSDDKMAAMPTHERVCHQVNCTCDEPSRLSLRTLSNVEFVAPYCDEHDPLEHDNHNDWEVYNGD